MSNTNILLLIVALILLLYGLGGYRKGFVRSLMSMAFLIMAAVLVYFVNPHVSGFLKERTPLYDVVKDGCEDIFTVENLTGKQEEGENLSRIEQTKIIDRLMLPEILKNQLTENNNASGYAKLAVSNFEDYLAGFMALLVLNILSYVVTFLLAVVLLKLTVFTLDIIADLPGLKGINRILGFVLGVVQGLCVVWILFLVLTVFGSTSGGSQILFLIGENSILSFLYDNNIFLKLLMGMFGGIL